MKQLYIDCHAEWCERSEHLCMNTQQVVFYHKGEIHIVKHPDCHQIKPHEIVWQLIKQSGDTLRMYKGYPPSRYDNYQDFEKEFRDFRLRGIKLRKWIAQVNFEYESNNYREYSIVSTIPFSEALMQADKASKEYKSLADVITNPKDLRDAQSLVLMNNRLKFVSDSNYYSTIEHARKSLIKTNTQ